jgi:molybdopterin-guanine dinucleotide biosynthesis protein A
MVTGVFCKNIIYFLGNRHRRSGRGEETVREDIAGAILAGGKNLRMGKRNKALLEMGGRTFLDRTIARIRPFFREIMIIGNDGGDYERFGIPVHPDIRPESGSLGGILTALIHSSAPRTFCVACDMPFLHPGIIARLLEAGGEGTDAVIPRLPKGLEPLCAVYSSRLVPRINELLDEGEKRVRLAVEHARTAFVDVDELRRDDPLLLSFFNINTPEDLETALALKEIQPS